MDQTEKTGITDRLKQLVAPLAQGILVTDVRIGLGYTAVELENDRLGLAYTFTGSHTGGCDLFGHDRPLVGRKAADLINLIESRNPIEAAVGVAACNAVINTINRKYLEGDVFSFLELKKDDQVCMVGNFFPIVSRLQSRVAELLVFEQITEPAGDLIPAEKIFDHLPDSQVVLLTATALINHTAEKILKKAGHCREVVLLGASTPLGPELYSGLPVTMLSGCVVTDTKAVKRTVSEGGGMKAFGRHIRKVNIRVTRD